ncbi:hypothetical protein [Sutcliffiella sp. NC1]|uniref:hypothetical protein n=1 Tax=Sutcliffiella sp. NC1 TaxID=3004096 RepID=UPI0022DDDD03|nr:hypothetical protein [Sutcliffiella sp. NC1]WBL16755.1 hypothetical protein O1A01_09025 [Sutcliffiella sp. NC1]
MQENIINTIRQSLLDSLSTLTPGHYITIVDEEGRTRTSRASEEILHPGEIGVVFCLPIIGAPTRRLPDVNLGRNQYVRAFCGLTTIDVFCSQRISGPPTRTVSMRTGEFFVITCER